MTRRWPLVFVVVACLSAATAVASDWDFLPELFVDAGGGWASNSVLDDGSGTNVTEWGADLSGDVRWRKVLGEYRAIDLGVYLAGSKLWQDEGSTVEPSSYAYGFSADGDLPFEFWRVKRISLGGFLESGSADFGSLDFGDKTRYAVAGMFTWQLTEIGCELGNTSVYLGRENLDDTQNGGDSDFDRTDDGGYELAGLEQSWVFLKGEAPDVICFRTGPFRQLVLNDYASFRGGWRYRRENTRGDLFDARVNSLYVAGRNPLNDTGRFAFEGRGAYTLIDYSQPRDDKVLEAEAGPRWSIKMLEGEPWFRYFDVRLAASWTRRDSNFDQFDYDRWAIHAGISIHLGPVPEGGSAPQGSSRVDRRDGAGGSEPAVQDDLDP